MLSYVDPKKVQSKAQALAPILRSMITNLIFGSLRKIILELKGRDNYFDIVRGY